MANEEVGGVALDVTEGEQAEPPEPSADMVLRRTEREVVLPGPLERTLAIIKPQVSHLADQIAEIIEDHGFFIIRRERFLLQPEFWFEFYGEHFGKSFFMNMCTFMASGPVEVMVLAKENAVEDWLAIIGPTDFAKAQEDYPNSLRARYGNSISNGIHGSDSVASAGREINIFFEGNFQPQEIDMRTYLKREVMPVMTPALAELAKARPANCILWLADYLKKNNPNRQLVNE